MTVLERLKAAGYDPAVSLFPDSMRRNRFHRPLRSRLVLRFWIHSVSELFRLFGLCSPVRSGKIPNK